MSVFTHILRFILISVAKFDSMIWMPQAEYNMPSSQVSVEFSPIEMHFLFPVILPFPGQNIILN